MWIYRFMGKRRYFWFWIALLSIGIIFYTEFYTYSRNTKSWPEVKCDNEKDCTRILLVADPQIIGWKQEPLHFLTPLTIFDIDWYLEKTYSRAYEWAQPDVVIYLGDLIDEGSIATDEEFYGYVRRIFNIFLPSGTSHVKHIWLPGDNDIGGEGRDVVTKSKLKRFEKAFAQPDLITHNNVTFFKINRLTQSIPVFKTKREFYDISKIFIGLSHVPLLFMPSSFVEKVIGKMQPQVLFTAHEHKSMIISTDALIRQDRQIIPVTRDDNKVFEYTLGFTDMYEFVIPTCSYRMGTGKIGFGFAVLERNELRYTVLWSPSRFLQLFHYLLFIAFVIVFFCFYFIFMKRFRRKFT